MTGRMRRWGEYLAGGYGAHPMPSDDSLNKGAQMTQTYIFTVVVTGDDVQDRAALLRDQGFDLAELAKAPIIDTTDRHDVPVRLAEIFEAGHEVLP